MKTNEIALQPLYEKSTFMFVFLKWKYISIYHIVTEELGQHLHLTFAEQMSNDER